MLLIFRFLNPLFFRFHSSTFFFTLLLFIYFPILSPNLSESHNNNISDRITTQQPTNVFCWQWWFRSKIRCFSEYLSKEKQNIRRARPLLIEIISNVLKSYRMSWNHIEIIQSYRNHTIILTTLKSYWKSWNHIESPEIISKVMKSYRRNIQACWRTIKYHCGNGLVIPSLFVDFFPHW